MSRRIVTLLGVVLTGSLLSTVPVSANKPTMNDYTAQPPFTTDGVTRPNVLFVFDASTSMARYAAQEINNGDWGETFEYSGYFDPMKCYTYDSANKRFEAKGDSRRAVHLLRR